MTYRERELAIEAHPDDIPWTQGGDVARQTKNHQVDSLLFTDGNGQGLSAIRLQEQRAEMDVLGMSNLYPVGYERGFKDGQLSTLLYQDMAQALLYVIDQAASEGFPYTILRTFNERGFSGHPDHMIVASVAQYTFQNRPGIKELIQVEMMPEEYALWPKDYFVHVPTPVTIGTIQVDISDTKAQKIESIRVHSSQLQNGGLQQIERVSKLPPREIYRYVNRV